MSSHTGNCPVCGRELHGAFEVRYASVGKLLFITTSETPDCNWRRCRSCGMAVCKPCARKINTEPVNDGLRDQAIGTNGTGFPTIRRNRPGKPTGGK